MAKKAATTTKKRTEEIKKIVRERAAELKRERAKEAEKVCDKSIGCDVPGCDTNKHNAHPNQWRAEEPNAPIGIVTFKTGYGETITFHRTEAEYLALTNRIVLHRLNLNMFVFIESKHRNDAWYSLRAVDIISMQWHRSDG